MSFFTETTTVRFNTGLQYNGRVYYQPMFYLAENYRLSKQLEQGSDIDKKRIDNDLVIQNDGIKLEFHIMMGSNKDDMKLLFIINQHDNLIGFTYKGIQYCLKTLDMKDLKNRMIAEKRDDMSLYCSYEISFEQKHQEDFEKFIKHCIAYNDKYFNTDTDDKDKISIYLTSTDGFYFQYLGKRNKRAIESIYLPKKQKDNIIQDMETFLKPETRSRYMKLGINHKRVYLLEGITGAGKTSLITALASKFNFNIAIVSFVPKMTDVDLLRCLRSLNDTYENENHNDGENNKKRQSIMVFEDIDCIFKERKNHDDNKNGITFSGLLNALDGVTSDENLICFITTNYKHNLDSALLRPGRIDYIMQFDYSTKEQILDMFKDFTGCNDTNKAGTFYNACVALKVKISTALLQQYFMKYIDKPDDAISNVEELKKMYEKSKIDKDTDETGIYQ